MTQNRKTPILLGQAPGKILIVKPSALGDIVHSLPFLAALRRHFPPPTTQIHWVVAGGLRGLLEGHPMIDRLWVIDKDEWKKIKQFRNTLAAIKLLALQLRQEGFDLVVDLQGLLRSGVIAWATRARVRVGFDDAREGSRAFYTHRLHVAKDIHAVDRYLKAAEYLGCPSNSLEYVFPPLPDNSAVLRSLPEEYAVIAPSAGAEAKQWPAERFGRLASRLALKAVIVSGESGSSLAWVVQSTSEGNAVSLAGRTSLKELIAVIKGARFLVSNDSGPMHIAAAFNVPVYALIGPTNPARTGPYGKIHTVIKPSLSCSPCYRRKRCADWKCMSSITVEDVLEHLPAESRA